MALIEIDNNPEESEDKIVVKIDGTNKPWPSKLVTFRSFSDALFYLKDWGEEEVELL